MAALAQIILYLHPEAQPQRDFAVSSVAGAESITAWNTVQLGSQPSQATLDATAIDPPFLAWLQTHGGDVTLTRRRLAQEALDAINHNELLTRAVVAVAASEINILRDWLAAFKTQTALAASLADLKTRVATLPTTPQRTLAQVRTAIKAEIAAGTVDT